MKIKVAFYVLMIIIGLAGCKAKKPIVVPSTYPVAEAIEIQATVQDTITMDEDTPPEVAKTEVVKLTHGNDMMRYCVILGSFIKEKNAVNLRSTLMNKGFVRSSIMQNNEGMYRVSAGCFNNDTQAKVELNRIRNAYPQFADAWLLQVKNAE